MRSQWLLGRSFELDIVDIRRSQVHVCLPQLLHNMVMDLGSAQDVYGKTRMNVHVSHQVLPPRREHEDVTYSLISFCARKAVFYTICNWSVTTPSTGEERQYIGLCETPFKVRYGNHLTSMRHEKYRTKTELSKHTWALADQGEEYSIKWAVIDRAKSYSNISKRCCLCLAEKLRIITFKTPHTLLNKRSELVSKCRHQNKFYLSTYSAVT